jgi:hypothetical protein
MHTYVLCNSEDIAHEARLFFSHRLQELKLENLYPCMVLNWLLTLKKNARKQGLKVMIACFCDMYQDFKITFCFIFGKYEGNVRYISASAQSIPKLSDTNVSHIYSNSAFHPSLRQHKGLTYKNQKSVSTWHFFFITVIHVCIGNLPTSFCNIMWSLRKRYDSGPCICVDIFMSESSHAIYISVIHISSTRIYSVEYCRESVLCWCKATCSCLAQL